MIKVIQINIDMTFFWDELKTIPDGTFTPVNIYLNDIFALQGQQPHPIMASAWQYGRDGKDYHIFPSLAVGAHHDGSFKGSALIYWLPWYNGSMTEVSIQTLNASGCTHFMTSEFSGCGFLVTNEYVGHVAHWAGSHDIYNTCTLTERSQVRTVVEARMRSRRGLPPPSLYRAISPSRLGRTPSSDFGATDSLIRSYSQIKGSIDRMIVFGYKDPQWLIGWSFKYALFTSDQRDGGVTWYTMPMPASPSSSRYPSLSDYDVSSLLSILAGDLPELDQLEPYLQPSPKRLSSSYTYYSTLPESVWSLLDYGIPAPSSPSRDYIITPMPATPGGWPPQRSPSPYRGLCSTTTRSALGQLGRERLVTSGEVVAYNDRGQGRHYGHDHIVLIKVQGDKCSLIELK